MVPRLTDQEKFYTLNSHTLLHKLFDSMFLHISVFLDSDWCCQMMLDIDM